MRSDVRFPSPLRRLELTAAALCLGSIGLMQPALAESTEVATLDSLVPHEMPVASNGTSYTSVPWNGNILADVHVEIDSGWSGHVKSWETWLRLWVPDGEEIEFPAYGAGASYPVFQRPHTVDVVKHLQIPAAAYDSFIVGQCNQLADDLRSEGLSDQQIFAEDRTIAIFAVAQLDVDFSGVVNPALQQAAGGNPRPNFQIVCKKWAGSDVPAAGAVQANFQVTGAKLAISPAYQNLTADCPVTVPLVAEFTATNAGSLKFRFVSAGGKVSQLRTVSITGKTGGVYKALYEEQIQVPLAQGGSAGAGQGSGGGIVNQQAGGGLAVQTQPEEPLFPTAPSSSGMGQVQVNPLAGNVHSESFRVEVVKPATGIISDYAGYRITCKPKAAGIATAPNLQMQPQAPQPDGATTVIGGIQTPPASPTPRRAQVQVPQMGALTSGAKADIMGTTLGFLLGSHHAWGSTVVIDKPQLVAATGVGPAGNLCRFAQAGYRPFNKGDVATGPFKNRVYRGSQVVDQSVHQLAPKQTDGWHVFPLELPSGLSTLRVVMDADRQVDESDEDNTFAVRVNVLLDCGGEVRQRVAPGQRQPSPLQRVAPLQPRLPQRQ